MVTQLANLIKMDLRRLLCQRSLMIVYLFSIVFLLIVDRSGRSTMFMGVILIYVWVNGVFGSNGEIQTAILPVSRQVVVLGKYLYSIIGTAIITLLTAAAQLLDWSQALFSPSMIFTICCTYTALTLPPTLYLGPAKARLYVICIYGVSVGIGAFLGATSKFAADFEMGAFSKAMRVMLYPNVSIICFALALVILSCLLSLRLYARKQF